MSAVIIEESIFASYYPQNEENTLSKNGILMQIVRNLPTKHYANLFPYRKHKKNALFLDLLWVIAFHYSISGL